MSALRQIRLVPLPVLLMVLSFLCPSELSLVVADLRLPPHRVVILALLPAALLRIWLRGDIRVRSFDALFLLYALWTVAAFAVHGKAGGGIVFGGSLAIESLGGYAIARAYIRNAPTCEATIHTLFVAIVVSGLIALPELVINSHLAHDIMHAVTGVEHPLKYEKRFGLLRAYGTFDHPIHLGSFCAGMFALIWFTTRGLAKRLNRAVLVSIATFVSLSSAPLLGVATQIGIMFWDRVTRGMPGRIILTVFGIFGVFLAVSVFAARSPFAWVATGLTIDSWNGYYRLIIWEHGLNNVWANPWFGIGLADWQRPWWMASASVDAFWLLITMRIGIPGFVLLALAALSLTWAFARRSARSRDRKVQRFAKAWLISLLALILMGCTVHFWNVLHAYFFFFLGMAGWVADPLRVRQRRDVRPVQRPAEIPGPLPQPA